MKIDSLVPRSESLNSQITELEGIKSSMSINISKIGHQIDGLKKIDKERKISYLLSQGWVRYDFKSIDINGTEIFPLDVIFLFKGDILPKVFNNATFNHYFGGNGVLHFSKATISFKSERLVAFENWIKTLNDDEYIVVEEKF